MKRTSVVLSISLLISGKDDMPKCLESLRFFKEAIPCEIILVDTGCTPEQRVLAEKYADKMIRFTWINDFAAARNAGLQEATGEWFLYLDDDEWFDNPSEIISFFKTGEYRNYRSAAYVVRNYTNAQGSFYEDAYLTRMVQLEPETRFVGKIHERLEPIKFPRKIFSDFVHHYGYVYRDEEEKRKHARRNIEPLLEMRKEYPGDPRWFGQLAQEYFAIGEYDKVLETCKAGLKEWDALEDKGSYAPVFVGATYGFILIALDSLDEYEEEKAWLERAFADPMSNLNFMEPTRAFYCMAGARLYSQTKEYDNCAVYFERYIECAKRLKDQKELLELGTASVVSGVFQEQMLYGTILMCLGAAIRAGNISLAEEAFFMLDWTDKRLLKQQKWELDILDACCGVNYHPAFGRILRTLASREGGMEEMYIVFLKTEIDYQMQGETEKIFRLHRLAAELEQKHFYVLYTKLLWNLENPDASTAGKRERATELFEELFLNYPEKIMETRADVWETAEQLKVPIEPMLLKVNFSTWKDEVDRWCREATVGSLQQWDRRIASWKREQDIRYDFFSMRCVEGYLRHHREIKAQGEALLGQMEELLWKYSELVMLYYGRIYQEWVLKAKPELLPEDAELGSRLEKLRQYREQGRDAEALRQLRSCIGVYAALEEAVESYAFLLRDAVAGREAEAAAAQNSLVQIVQSLKLTAKQRLEMGDKQTAEKILGQVLQCMPQDTEARELLEKSQER